MNHKAHKVHLGKPKMQNGKPKVHFGGATVLPKTVETGTPGGSAFLCLANATSAIGQGCDAASQQAYSSFLGKQIATNTNSFMCIQVMNGVCVQSDFVSIQAVSELIWWPGILKSNLQMQMA